MLFTAGMFVVAPVRDRRIAVSLFAALILTASACAAAADPEAIASRLMKEDVVARHGRAIVYFERGAFAPHDREEFARLVDRGLDAIGDITKVTPPAHVDVFVAHDVGISITYPHFTHPRVFLSSGRVAHREAPYLHELVHAVMGDGGAKWLEEGFASYVASIAASRHAGYYAVVMSGTNANIDAEAEEALREGGLGDGDREHFYTLAQSLTKYIVEHAGLEAVVAAHRANDIRALARTTGHTEAEWRREWLRSLH